MFWGDKLGGVVIVVINLPSKPTQSCISGQRIGALIGIIRALTLD